MRKTTLYGVGVIAFLVVVSGGLWGQLRSERDRASDLEEKLSREQASYPQAAEIHSAPNPVVGKSKLDVAVVETTEPRAVSNAALTSVLPISDIARAYQTAEGTAKARVAIWASRLASEGKSLTPAQRQILDAAAMSELRLETDETLALAISPAPARKDAYARAQEQDRFVDRQDATNRRVLVSITPHLAPAQLEGLRTQFDAWYAGAKASARVELERAAGSSAP